MKQQATQLELWPHTSHCEDFSGTLRITHHESLQKHLLDILALSLASWNGRTLVMCRSCSTEYCAAFHRTAQ